MTVFTYDGAQFDESSWTREAEGRFVSPDGKLVFGAEVREWKEWPVSEIRPFLHAKARTGVIERFTPAVMTLPLRGETVRIRRVQGSETKANDDFRRRDVVLSADRPFFTMEETTGWPASASNCRAFSSTRGETSRAEWRMSGIAASLSPRRVRRDAMAVRRVRRSRGDWAETSVATRRCCTSSLSCRAIRNCRSTPSGSTPAAWTAIVERVDRIITENGVDIYRQDFNMNVLEGLLRDEAPDRQGASEIRYVNGLWAFWDELRRRHPDLMFDNCASGGKRLDYEMNSRSASYWRDDALAGSVMPELSQAINLNATPFIPFSGGPMPINLMDDDYAMLSALSPTVVVMSQGRNVDYEAMLPKIRRWSVLAQRLRVLRTPLSWIFRV